MLPETRGAVMDAAGKPMVLLEPERLVQRALELAAAGGERVA